VRVLAIADGNSVPAWNANVLKGCPDLDALAGGFTLHPYGNAWRARIDGAIAALATAAKITNLAGRLQVTEWGLSSDNGRLLSDNYGWNKAMSYSEAASTLKSVLAAMRSVYGERIGAFYLYQAHDQYGTGTQTGREAYFGALQSNGADKGAYTAEVKAEIAAARLVA